MTLQAMNDMNPSPMYKQSDLDPNPMYGQSDLDPNPKYGQSDLDPNPKYGQTDLDPNPKYGQSDLDPNLKKEADGGPQRTRVRRNNDPNISPSAVEYQENDENNIRENRGAADDDNEENRMAPYNEIIEPYAVAYMEEERTSGSSQNRAATNNSARMNARGHDLSRNDADTSAADRDDGNIHRNQVPSNALPPNPADWRNALNPNPMYVPNVAQRRTCVCTCTYRQLCIAVAILLLLIFGACFAGYGFYLHDNQEMRKVHGEEQADILSSTSTSSSSQDASLLPTSSSPHGDTLSPKSATLPSTSDSLHGVTLQSTTSSQHDATLLPTISSSHGTTVLPTSSGWSKKRGTPGGNLKSVTIYGEEGPGHLSRGLGVAVSSDGELFVTVANYALEDDNDVNLVQVFNMAGEFLRTIPTVVPSGTGRKTMSPTGVAIDGKGYLWVIGVTVHGEHGDQFKPHAVQYDKQDGRPVTSLDIQLKSTEFLDEEPAITVDLQTSKIIVAVYNEIWLFLRNGSLYQNFVFREVSDVLDIC
ncbi:Hypp61 [Branchiostoma lanceolatum]|uniref:Hypp61 protein n=1 Tax=Branchiostoma lanceolatum TaxID=7740 RepID=A0A8J9YHF5_BRALA|nr:Hypp61 [Branchiostoma lanceolatum]